MQPGQVINIAATSCPPQSEKEYNEWYDEKLIPLHMKFKGLLETTRYRLANYTPTGAVKQYPQYLTTYKFQDMDGFKTWNSSAELATASEWGAEIFARLGIEFTWRAQYEVAQTWKKTPPFSVVLMVGSESRPENEERFIGWYAGKHIPDIVKVKGILGITRFRLAGSAGISTKSQAPEIQSQKYPRNLIFVHFPDRAAADAYDTSPERAASGADVKQAMKEYGLSVLWRAQYEPLRIWQQTGK